MKAYRIGNTINIHWTISQKNGEPFMLNHDSIELVAVATHHTLVIDDFSIDGNVVTWIFKGADQKFLGTYSLTLVQNRGKVDMVTIDCCEAFVLVPWSCLAGGNDESGLETESVDLESTVTQTQISLSPEIKAAISAAVEPKQDKSDNTLKTTAKTIPEAINEVYDLANSGSNPGINDAPKDGKTYGRKNGVWTEITNGEGGSSDAVLYTEQTLSDEQQEQARANIGAQSTTDDTLLTKNKNIVGAVNEVYSTIGNIDTILDNINGEII